MTLEETAEILRFLRGCYPAFYRRATPEEAESTLLAWSTLFAEPFFTYPLVLQAVREYVTGKHCAFDAAASAQGSTEYRRFPPSPGELRRLLEERRKAVELVRISRRESRVISPPGGR